MRFIWGAAGIDHNYAPRLASRNGEIRAPHSSKEAPALLLETVLVSSCRIVVAGLSLVPPACAIVACGHIRVHQDGEVGQQTSTQDSMQGQHNFTAQLASAALIGLSGIGKPIAQHNLALAKSRLDHFGNVL